MNRMRSLSFPRLSSAKDQDTGMSTTPGILAQSHSRSSSGSSASTAPITPTFSTTNRSHSRWPSSTSSLVSVPDSPVNVNKSALGDLVEDPAEREDSFDGLAPDSIDEPLCICGS
jgi:hypothetical protein